MPYAGLPAPTCCHRRIQLELTGETQEFGGTELAGRLPKGLGGFQRIPSGKHTKSYGKSPSFLGKPTISMGHVQ